MVEKADTGRNLGRAAAVERDPALDPRLLGVALDRRDPHGCSPDLDIPPLPPARRRRPFNKNGPDSPLRRIIAGEGEGPVHNPRVRRGDMPTQSSVALRKNVT